MTSDETKILVHKSKSSVRLCSMNGNILARAGFWESPTGLVIYNVQPEGLELDKETAERLIRENHAKGDYGYFEY